MGGNMKLTTITFVAGAAIASIATADTVAPGDVKFDDYGAVAASLTGVAGAYGYFANGFQGRPTAPTVVNAGEVSQVEYFDFMTACMKLPAGFK